MGKSRICIFIMTVLLVCTLLFLGNLETEYPFVTASIPAGDGTETVKPWYDTYTGTVYFFLPGSAELEDVTLHIGDKGAYFFGDINIEDGMNCSGFQWDARYDVEGPVYDGKELVFVRSSRMPAMFLDLDSGSMDYLHEDKDHSEHGYLRLYDSDGESLYQGEANKVKGRGQSSWLEEKKSYNISLRRDADLLGMGSAQNWVLQANSKDHSSIRNKMIFEFADAAGLLYAPDCEWVDLYLNGEYAGLYLLTERIEIHPERVDIPEENSFLVTKDGYWRIQEANNPYIMTQTKASLEIKYSDLDTQTLQHMFQSVENAILSADGIDSASGKHWSELIDMESWVNKYLIEEVFGNMDGQHLSQYYYLDGSREDERISAGPVWDYDLAVQDAYNAYHMSKPDNGDSRWQPALFANETFFACLQRNYATVFRPLLEETMGLVLDGYAGYIRESHNSDSLRWGYWAEGRLNDEIQEIRQYLQQRAELFDRIWTNEENHIRITLVDWQGGVFVRIQEPGTLLPELEATDGYGWFRDTDGCPADSTGLLYEDVTLRQRKTDPEAPVPTEIVEEEAYDAELPLRRYLPMLILPVALVVLVAVDREKYHGNTRYREKEKTQQH